MHDDSNQDLPISSGFRVHRRPRRESTPGEALFAYAFVVAIGVALGAAGGAFLPFLVRRRFTRSAAIDRAMTEPASAAITRAVIGGVIGAACAFGFAARAQRGGYGAD
ncbi:MAG: hypothetical protein R3F62_31650 [Planctomycetota bacterium]